MQQDGIFFYITKNHKFSEQRNQVCKSQTGLSTHNMIGSVSKYPDVADRKYKQHLVGKVPVLSGAWSVYAYIFD